MPYIPDETVDQPGLYAPLALAFVGDGVYELYVRTRLMRAGSLQANKLHRLATQYVKAGAQAVSVRAILDKLTEEESAVYRRGREREIRHRAQKRRCGGVPDGDRVRGAFGLFVPEWAGGAPARNYGAGLRRDRRGTARLKSDQF